MGREECDPIRVLLWVQFRIDIRRHFIVSGIGKREEIVLLLFPWQRLVSKLAEHVERKFFRTWQEAVGKSLAEVQEIERSYLIDEHLDFEQAMGRFVLHERPRLRARAFAVMKYEVCENVRLDIYHPLPTSKLKILKSVALADTFLMANLEFAGTVGHTKWHAL
jgi:hypothetical protein